MERGTQVFVIGGQRGVIHKVYSQQNVIVKMGNGSKKQYSNTNILPVECDDFITQQKNIIIEIVHFSSTYASLLPSDARISNGKLTSFVEEYTTGLHRNGDVCTFMGNFLALQRNVGDVPYAYLNRIDTCHTTAPKDVVTLQGRDVNAILKTQRGHKVISIRKDGQLHHYQNRKVVYSLDMGFMYLLLVDGIVKDAFTENCIDIQEFENCMYAYEPNSRYLLYRKNKTVRKIVGLGGELCLFLLYRQQRFNIYKCRTLQFTQGLLNEPPMPMPTAKQLLSSHDPVTFLHVQFITAWHMRTYIKSEKLADGNDSWTTYAELCDEVVGAIKIHEIDNVLDKPLSCAWNPHILFDLMARFDLSNGYLLDSEWFNYIFKSVARQQAWIANLHAIAYAYNSLVDGGDIKCEVLLMGKLAVIDNCIVGSFDECPVKIQAIVHEHECAFIRSQIQLEVLCSYEVDTTPSACTNESFCPPLDAFLI